MSDLNPCPFCGSKRVGVHRHKQRRAIGYKAMCLDCGVSQTGVAYGDIEAAIEAWSRRAQPAQAVPASCGECGKKTSDGWALYCVACMEKAGLPGGTSSPPLTHPCTSSRVRTPNSIAQAGQVLTDEDVAHLWQNVGKSGASSIDSIELTRAIEQAVLAKRVPMTDAQIEHALRSEPMADNEESFALGIRHAERHHGIVGKEGA